MNWGNIKFDPEDLRVESFGALPERQGKRGTVQGYTHLTSCTCTTDSTCCGCTLGCSSLDTGKECCI